VKLDDIPVEDKSGGNVTAPGPGGGKAAWRRSSPIPPPLTQAGPANVARIIYFDYDSYVIKPEFQSLIEAHARFLKANNGRKIAIEGHTDERGGREYNLALGQRRSEAVRRSLGLLGVPDTQVEAVSFGKENPPRREATKLPGRKTAAPKSSTADEQPSPTFVPPVWRRTAAAFAAALCLGASSVASAALFEDDEARRAILELRQQRANADRLAEEQRQEISQLRRSLLDLQTQIESLRGEIARLNGQNEQQLRDLADVSGARRTSPRVWTSGCARSNPPRFRWTAASSSPTRPRPASSRPRWRSSARATSRRLRPHSLNSSSVIRKAVSGPRRSSGWAMRSMPIATTAAPSRISVPC
jgi:peptidoglycan-associated lipoprotein